MNSAGRQLLTGAAFAVNVTSTNLGNIINGETSDLNAVFSGDGRIMIYTSVKRDVNNIMYAENIGGAWTKPKAITRQITTKNNFRPTYLSPDGTVLYLAEDDPFNSEIYISTANRGRWSGATKLKKPVNSKMNETHASLSPDGKTLYFTSDRSGGLGDLDIYYSNLDEKGRWGKPVNMGSKINTIYNEETPFVSPDGNRLYFSSEGHEGMGGYDIYYFSLHEPGSEPVNMGYPVNTTDNDLFYVPGSNKYLGYYSHMASDGYGDRDIYSVEIHPEVMLRGEIIPDNSPANIDTGRLLISIIDPDNYNTISWIRPYDVSGSFKCKLIPGKYLLSVNAPDYEIFTKDIDINQDPSFKEMNITANLIYTGAPTASIDDDTDNSAVDLQVADATTVEYGETVTSAAEEIAPLPENIPVEPDNNGLVMTSFTEEHDIPVEIPEEKQSEPIVYNTAVSSASNKKYTFIDEVVDELNDVSSIPQGTPVTYTVQIFALSKPVDLSYFRNLENISVQLAPDDLYKYTWGTVNTMIEAKELCKEVLDRGYRDVIIRRRSIVPSYTIQVMAGKAPVNFKYFGKLDRLKVSLGTDGYYRYTYGEYENIDDAAEDLTKMKEMGYTGSFIRKM